MNKFARILAILVAALLWQSVAHADLDDIRRAAEAGNAEAQLELGILFQYGFNYKDNQIPALTWYILSASQGNAKAAKLRDALKAKMSEQDAGEAADQAAKFKPTVVAPSAAPAAVSTPAAETKEPAPTSPAETVLPVQPPTEPAAPPASEPAPAQETPPAEAPAPAAAPVPTEPAPGPTPAAPATK